MNFFIDLFLEFLAILICIIGWVCGFAGAIFAIIGAVLAYVNWSLLDSFSLPASFHWSYGIVIMLVGVLLAALSSVMRKRISNPRR
jgi:hypothetical protein